MKDPSLTAPEHSPHWAPVPAVPAALAVAYDALAGTSMAGAATIVVTGLDAAGMLQAPGENAELRGLVAQASGYSALYRQECAAGQHREWFADVAEAVPCPWCEIAQLQAAASISYRALRGGIILGTFTTVEAAGACAEADLRNLLGEAACQWEPNPDATGVHDLVTVHRGHTSATEYWIQTVIAATEFDPDADA